MRCTVIERSPLTIVLSELMWNLQYDVTRSIVLTTKTTQHSKDKEAATRSQDSEQLTKYTYTIMNLCVLSLITDVFIIGLFIY